MSELERVRIGKGQNWKVSETAEIVSVRICSNGKMSETARIGKCQKLIKMESVRNCLGWKVSEL